jgi:hypothetical protein
MQAQVDIVRDPTYEFIIFLFDLFSEGLNDICFGCSVTPHTCIYVEDG